MAATDGTIFFFKGGRVSEHGRKLIDTISGSFLILKKIFSLLQILQIFCKMRYAMILEKFNVYLWSQTNLNLSPNCHLLTMRPLASYFLISWFLKMGWTILWSPNKTTDITHRLPHRSPVRSSGCLFLRVKYSVLTPISPEQSGRIISEAKVIFNSAYVQSPMWDYSKTGERGLGFGD